MFEIEKNVPLSGTGKAKAVEGFFAKLALTFENMEVGDSFYLPFDKLKKTTLLARIRGSLKMAQECGRLNPSFNIKTRVEGEGIRIWRNIEKAEDQA